MNILGQDKILKFIDRHTLTTLPRTIMLEGLSGSGKHIICNHLAEKFGLVLEDISESLTYEKIEEITLRVEPVIYIINAEKLTTRTENTILKFLEEPLKNAFVVILTTSRYNLIATIRNRCYILTLDTYNKEQLKLFISNVDNENIILTICKTPGDVIKMQSHPIQDMLDLGIKIFDKIGIASFANTLTLSNNIAFKNEKDKYDFNIFMRALVYISKMRVINNEVNAVLEYKLTNDYYNRAITKNVDKKALFENYLLTLKQVRG